MNLEPGTKFVIPYQLNDPADTNTYYCRAYIRKAVGDDLIATVNLEDKGDGRFLGEWYVPQYNVPTQIIITTKVFTDAGYTTESLLFWRANESHIIQQSWSPVFGGGGGSDISYKKIEEILRKIIKDEVKYPSAEKIDWQPVFSEIQRVIRAVEDKKMPEFPKIEFPKQEKTDFAPIIKELEKLGNLVGKIENFDSSPIVSYLHDIEKEILKKTEFEELKKVVALIPETIDGYNTKKSEDNRPLPVKPKRKFNLTFERKEKNNKRAFVF